MLFDQGRVIKLCDFGTVRVVENETFLTNQKGSAAWMAPEVFEGSTYTEKCDIYSWAITLWEILSRRKPYAEMGGFALRILWAVSHGTRPCLLRNCPKILEDLMVRCWDKDADKRPQMKKVEEIMQKLFDFYVDTNSSERGIHLIIPSNTGNSSTQSNFMTTNNESPTMAPFDTLDRFCNSEPGLPSDINPASVCI